MPAPTAPNDDEALAALVQRIERKRRDVDRYLATARSRRGRLVHVTLVAGALAATLTAAPAFGGQPMADWLTESFALPTPSWRILCAIAAVCSLAATIATQLQKSGNYEDHIARAQGVRAALEVLDVGIASGHLDRQEATRGYLRCVEDAAFIASGNGR